LTEPKLYKIAFVSKIGVIPRKNGRIIVDFPAKKKPF